MAAADRAPTVLMVLEATFPKLGGGGAESQVLTLGRSLRERGIAVRVVVPRVADGPQAAREDVEGLEVVRLAYPRVPLLGGAVMLARLAAMLVLKRGEYDAIHAHIAHNMAFVCAVVGRALGKRVIVKLTGMREMQGGILDPAPGRGARLRRAGMRLATRLQATSSRLQALCLARGFAPEQVLVLPNGVDAARFAAERRDAGLRREIGGDASLVGIFVGRLAPEKGLELLVDAWARAFAHRGDVRLVLVGDGGLRGELAARAERLGIAGQVHFAGHRGDVAPLLAASDFAILTSLAEGLSNALLEYMAAGLPVVGSRVSGTEDFVSPGETGWLFEPGDGEALAGRLAELGRSGPEALAAMGRAARERILARASREAVTGALLAEYGLAAADGGA